MVTALLPKGAVTENGDARTGRFHCGDCGLFVKNRPDYTEFDAGVDVDVDFEGYVTRTGWETETEVRICTFCGYHTRTDVEIDR